MKNLKSAAFFKEKREQKGLTQEDVAKSLGYTSKQIVSNWERGLCTPPLASLAPLTKILGIKKSEMIEIFLKETEQAIERQFNKSRPRTRGKSA